MGSIYKDGDGYRVAVQVGHDPATGKPRYRKARVGSQEEAVATLKRLHSEQSAGRLGAAAGTNVSDYLASWLENHVKPFKQPATYRQYEWIVRDHIVPLLGKKRLDKVTRPDVQKLIAAKAGQKVSPRDKDGKATTDKTLSRNTLRLIRAVLHSAYEEAVKDGLASHNPTNTVKVPDAPKKPPAFLKPEEAASLSQALAGTELETLLRLMLATGLRVGEATGIRWQDLDLKGRRVHVRGQLQRLDGKLRYKEATKTKEERAVPISASLAERLKVLQAERLVDAEQDPDGIAFLNAEGRRLDPKYVSGRLKAACLAAGVPPVSPHKLRHTAATLALMETGDLHGVQKLLGHKQVSLTADLYGHATAQALQGVTDAIERVLNRTRD